LSGNQKLALKGQWQEILTSDFFFMNLHPVFTTINMSKIAEVKLSSCGLELRTSEKIAIAK
jgi:hypothetical protein